MKAPYADIVEVPETCELAVRKKGDKRFLFVLNYMKEEAKITLHKEGVNLYTGEKIKGEVTLPKYGTIVIEIN